MADKEFHDFIKKISIEDFSGYLGNSYLHRVNLLDKLIGNNHHPSIGDYKEKLLMEILKDHVPSRYSVGTGFALFAPMSRFDPVADDEFEVSNQLDIIIYDNYEIPVIYKDGDFVILRPEAIKCIVEVKGSAHKSDIVGTKNKNGYIKKTGTVDKCCKYKKALKRYNDEVYHHTLNNTGLNKTNGAKSKAHDLQVKYYLFCWDVYRNEIGTKMIVNKLKEIEQEYLVDGVYRYNKWMLFRKKNSYEEFRGTFENSLKQQADKTIWDIVHNILYSLPDSKENIVYDNLKTCEEAVRSHDLA